MVIIEEMKDNKPKLYIYHVGQEVTRLLKMSEMYMEGWFPVLIFKTRNNTCGHHIFTHEEMKDL